jgi:hypothetical protein
VTQAGGQAAAEGSAIRTEDRWTGRRLALASRDLSVNDVRRLRHVIILLLRTVGAYLSGAALPASSPG